ncbi:hypothetical protein FJT64_004587 [Amphibalanus amphitrite]|uniref:Uncharacterized protein n=1 Tax=Amphibalanus amphitrite TaxID=1232801 RepID=A0A6A4VYX3_AMPAM|nr:hypothetical protein FJT64_004587 [Amphibalanus amphitrite]
MGSGSSTGAPKKYITVEWKPNQETDVDEGELLATGGGRQALRSRRGSRVAPAAVGPARPVSPSPTYTVSPAADGGTPGGDRRRSTASPLPAVSQPAAPLRPQRRKEATLVNQMVFSSRPPSGLAADGRSAVVYLPQVEVDRLLRSLTAAGPAQPAGALPGMPPPPSAAGRDTGQPMRGDTGLPEGPPQNAHRLAVARGERSPPSHPPNIVYNSGGA